jgi:hypothetical protein
MRSRIGSPNPRKYFATSEGEREECDAQTDSQDRCHRNDDAPAGRGPLYLALFDGADWGLEWYDVAVGLGVLPAAVMGFGLATCRYANGPVRFTGSAGTTANCLVIVALAVNPYTAGGAALFYGAALLVAAWRAQPGCEATVVSNSILGRDDQLGCPVFSPIDEAEVRLKARKAGRERQARPAVSSLDNT